MSASDQAIPPRESRRIPAWLRALIGIPMGLLGGITSSFIGLFLLICALGRISGEPPERGLMGVFFAWLIFGAAPLSGWILCRSTESARKRFRWRLLAVVFLLFLIVGADGALGPKNWHRAFSREKLPGIDAAKLTQTIVTPHLETGIAKGTNLLWCGTFQLAWNEACRLTGGDLQLADDPTLGRSLNKHTFNKDSLDESCYVAMAGFVKDNIHDAIRKAIEAKFQGAHKPRLIPDKARSPNGKDLVVYAFLWKHLTFATPFERIDDLLRFEGTLVPAFGISRYKKSLENLYPQVSILDYQNEDDFIVELKTQSGGDRLILAKLKPNSNLGEILETVGKRIREGHTETAGTNDFLLVPRIKLDITKRYSEIENRRVIPKDPRISKDLYVTSALQNILFEMNEKGVELKSEAHMTLSCSKEARPALQHVMVFDKPFLILMQKRDSKVPYFAFWVDNTEALVSWK